MMARLAALPLFILLMAGGGLAMLVPAIHALEQGDPATARAFLYGAALLLGLTLLIGLAIRGRAPRRVARGHLLTLFAAYGILPLLLALPFHQAVPGMVLSDAWFEMISAITTTGAKLWRDSGELNLTLHLWRGIVGWLGGFLAWVMAFSVLSPLILEWGGPGVPPAPAMGRPRAPGERLVRDAGRLLPIYAGLTGLLWLGLILTGDPATIAFCHAMAVISTSGISPVGGPASAGGEVVVFVFLAFALSRASFLAPLNRHAPRLWTDVEMRLGLALITLVALALFLRVLGMEAGVPLRTLWAALFTAASFLTTTGFESQLWGVLAAPQMVLMGLALIGGGVGTAAGGVKLLRLYAVFRHGQREVQRLIHPSSVGGAGPQARRTRRERAVLAWVFLMLYSLSTLVIVFLLSLTSGLDLETILTIAIASLTTTGQLAGDAFAGLNDAARLIAALAMILGRLETLALIALLNPDFWRD